MKTSTDPRHRKRIAKVQALFAYSFQGQPPVDVEAIVEHLETIDSKIRIAAPEWPLDKINKLDLAVLRVAVFELIHDSTIPAKVVVDEAVEIAKIYGSESSPAFVNGVLGSMIIHKEQI